MLLVVLLSLPALPALSQLSGYISGGMGYNTNPLYNYERDGDQVAQTYLELAYTDDSPFRRFRASYVSGWMVFNRIAERNYYEHNIVLGYHLSLAEPPADGADEEDASAFREGDLPRLDLGLKAGARHDRSAFKEFDNYGSELTGTYTLGMPESWRLRVESSGGYRHYVYLDPLSNATGAVTVLFGRAPARGWEYGVRATTGLKYFTTSLFDTTLFESTRTFVLKASGKGKGGARIRVPSDKKLLVDAEDNAILQLAGGFHAGFSWEGGSARAEVLYRNNPGSTGRYLAQYTNTSILNEDIYNDHFSYEGPDLSVTLRQVLPARIQTVLTLQAERKVFTAPAFDLNGVETAGDRVDRRVGAELYVSRYFDLVDGLGMDLAAAVTVLRNQSNDMYNDFSVTAFSLFLGFGF
jgi:hypothetical protein